MPRAIPVGSRTAADCALAIACLLASAGAVASQFELQLDARAIATDARRSFLDGGLGKLRFGEESSPLEVGRLRLGYRGALGEWLHFNVEASTWSEDDTNPIDLTEAYLELRPIPQSAWRSRVRAGAFYPRISLEHRAAGWSNPYTLSSSALNTWVGEELRTVGVEYALDWRGSLAGSEWDAGADAALFGWNDPAGVVVAVRGFALHDRQTPLFGRLRTLPLLGPQDRVLFAEIDDRPGYHVGAHVRHRGRTELRALLYDNRADPAAFDAGVDDYAWETVFRTAGLRHDADRGLTTIVQWLDGSTFVGRDRHDRWDFDTAFVLLSQQLGRHRVAGRVDRFAMTHRYTSLGVNLGRDRGDAYALAWTFEPRPRLELTLEGLQVDSDFNWRRRLGELPAASERSLQLGVRYTFEIPAR
jgi:hypothetical protein